MFEEALHTYFAVSDVEQGVRCPGSAAARSSTRPTGCSAASRQARGLVADQGDRQRLSRRARRGCAIDDPGLAAAHRDRQDGRRLGDRVEPVGGEGGGDGRSRRRQSGAGMVCVETGNVADNRVAAGRRMPSIVMTTRDRGRCRDLSAARPAPPIVVLGPSGAALGRAGARPAAGRAACTGRARRRAIGTRPTTASVPHLAALFAAGPADRRALRQRHPDPRAGAAARRQARGAAGGRAGRGRLGRGAAARRASRRQRDRPAPRRRRSGGVAAITTAGDLRLGFALDEPPPGWRIANPERVKPIAAALLAGAPVALVDELGCRRLAARRQRRLGRDAPTLSGPASPTARYRPMPSDAGLPPAGAGARHRLRARLRRRGDRRAGARQPSPRPGSPPGAVAAVVSVELKLDEPAIHALAERARRAGAVLSGRAAARRDPAPDRALGGGVSRDRLLGRRRGRGARRRRPGRGAGRAEAQVAARDLRRSPAPRRRSTPAAIGRARGRLAIVGIGPGDAGLAHPGGRARCWQRPSDIVGYSPLSRSARPRRSPARRRHASAIGAEAERARLALDLAAAGGSVALVSSGDAGIYGLAALVFELLDREARRDWAAVEIVVAPGVSAMQAAAARVGAPLGHDFCAISLSDLMTPWAAIRARLEAAARRRFRRRALQPALGAAAGRGSPRPPRSCSRIARRETPVADRPQSRPRRRELPDRRARPSWPTPRSTC